MLTLQPAAVRKIDEPREPRDPRMNAPLLLRLTAVATFVVPSNMIVAPLGATGFVAMILATMLFLTWIASSLFGNHNPLLFSYPARLGIGALWLASVPSYILMQAEPLAVASANRWLLTLVGLSGIILVTAEVVRTKQALISLVRALVGGATVCAVVAAFQFITNTNPVPSLQTMLIGLTDNGNSSGFQFRGGFTRVSGTLFNPLELGVVMAMILPFAIWKATFCGASHRWISLFQCLAIAGAAVFSVSRSMMVCLATVLVISIPFFTSAIRRWSVVVVPAAVTALFVTVPNLIGTLIGAASEGSTDPSIKTRLDNYPRVEAAVREHPTFGMGPGTYLVDNILRILDNQYLKTAVEMGLVGVVALLLYLLLPAFSGIQCAQYFKGDPMLRSLSGCVAGAAVGAAVAAATFDELSFPTVTVIFAFVAGLSGSIWMIAKEQREKNTDRSNSTFGPHHPIEK